VFVQGPTTLGDLSDPPLTTSPTLIWQAKQTPDFRRTSDFPRRYVCEISFKFPVIFLFVDRSLDRRRCRPAVEVLVSTPCPHTT